jgi:hypothetical protein
MPNLSALLAGIGVADPTHGNAGGNIRRISLGSALPDKNRTSGRL